MKYMIISIDESRADKKAAIRAAMSQYEEIPFAGVNGRDKALCASLLNKHGLSVTNWTAKVGELGIWLSMMEAWEKVANETEPVIVFEDDAIVADVQAIETMLVEIPEGWDSCALFVPDNQMNDFFINQTYNEYGIPVQLRTPLRQKARTVFVFDIGLQNVCRAYQGYSCVSVMYTPEGARRAINLARLRGIDTPVDCFLYEEIHAGRLNGYAHKPDSPRPVVYDWENSPTLVQDTELHI